MTDKTIPFTKRKIQEIIKTYPTPFHIYDEKAIRNNARKLYDAFSWVKSFKNYFAVKACPNPFIMKILKQEGMGADCSSLPELLLSEKAGIRGEDIMLTSNDTPADEFLKAIDLDAIINLDDSSHISFLEKILQDRGESFPDLICFRYNPGPLKKGNAIIGHPEEAKYGFTKEQLLTGYRHLKAKGIKRFGLHTMVASNELNAEYHIETAKILFNLVHEIRDKTGIEIEFVNLGGGYGIPYKPGSSRLDLYEVSRGIRTAYNQIIVPNNLDPLRIVMECGRMVTGPYGYLVSKVRHLKHIYKNYVGLDACMANLMRPALYGAYHHITVVGKEHLPENYKYDVTGSLCENNDKFAIDRNLPEIKPGDLLVIHDAGAHGFAMGFNYNGKLRSSELLLRNNGKIIEIRRLETPEDYFATLDFNALKKFR